MVGILLENVGLDLKLILVVDFVKVRNRDAEPDAEVLLKLLLSVILSAALVLGSGAFEAWKLRSEICFWLSSLLP